MAWRVLKACPQVLRELGSCIFYRYIVVKHWEEAQEIAVNRGLQQLADVLPLEVQGFRDAEIGGPGHDVEGGNGRREPALGLFHDSLLGEPVHERASGPGAV